MPAFQDETKSPCQDCEHIYEDKKRFPSCVNCLDRFNGKTRFIPKKKGGFTKRKQPRKPCKWPHGCSELTVKSDYCTDHQRLIQDRKRRYKKQGYTEEQMAIYIMAPAQKGPNADPLA